MSTLKILIIDDSETDAKLIARELRRGFPAVEVESVEDEASTRAAFAKQEWSLVLCEWSMPRFGANAALALMKELGLDIPFIIVSGTIGEEATVEATRAGAHDYVLKDNLARLVPAVARELRDHAARRACKQAENALRLSNERFGRLWDAGIVGIVVADLLGNVHESNDAALQMFGYSRDEMREVHWPDLTPPESLDVQEEVLAQLGAVGVSRLREVEMLKKGGGRVPVLIGVAMLDLPNCIVFVADLTDRKRAEESLRVAEGHLRQAQKMEAIGRLAGGVAHDFNNLLTVVLSYSSMAIETLSPGNPLREDLEEIEKAGRRAAELTRQLLAFSRQQVLLAQTLDLNESVGKMDKMLRRVLREDVDLTVVAGASLWLVDADPGQFDQILMNLAVNARDAMPQGGKLTVATSNVEVAGGEAQAQPGLQPGEYVVLEVTDTGMGMEKAIQARIFEPFFTTKDAGRGTGLGLATSFGIAQQSGGTIVVDSDIGRGTTFRVYFPRSRRAKLTLACRAPSLSPARAETSTILLSEDEEQVRQLVQGILQRAGYCVIVARNAEDALRLSEKHVGDIDLLLTDVVMPVMNGRQLAERMLTLRPKLLVLYMSGYAGNVVVERGVLDEGINFIQKPITPRALLSKVRAVLDLRAE